MSVKFLVGVLVHEICVYKLLKYCDLFLSVEEVICLSDSDDSDEKPKGGNEGNRSTCFVINMWFCSLV